MIYFEVGETLNSGIETGIQRVVKELGIALSQLESETGASVGLVALNPSGEFYHLVDPAKWRAHNLTKEPTIKIFLVRFIRANRLLLLPARLILKFRIVKRLKRYLWDAPLHVALEIEDSRSIQITMEPGDILYTAESFWNDEDNVSRFETLKTSGVKLHVFVHDILPLSHPRLFEDLAVSAFKSNFSPVLLLADRVYVASLHVKSQLTTMFPSIPSPVVINLGANLSSLSIKPSESLVCGSNGMTALAIGTIEPRKNYAQLLSWVNTSKKKFCLEVIGRRGWKSGSLYWRLRFNSKIRLLGAVSDEVLDSHLMQTDIGICASIDEGFGLPLREFLSRGIPVVASNIPPFHEVPNGSKIFYFDLGDNESLDRAVTQAFAASRGVPVVFPTWEECAKELIGKIC